MTLTRGRPLAVAVAAAALSLSCSTASTRPPDAAAPGSARGRMKAARVTQYGGPDVLSVADVDVPVPGAGQVLIEVHASSINPVDTYIREGKRQARYPMQLPFTLGWDVAGVVIATGPGVTGFGPGDPVFGKAGAANGGTGAYAEYALVEQTRLAAMPRTIDFAGAGSLPTVGTTALQAVQAMQLQRGRKVLVHGGGGGVGSVAIEVARSLGAQVATTATGDDLPFVRQLGADPVVDYRAQRFEDVLSGYDAVLDTVGGDTWARSIRVLRKGGILVSITHPPDLRPAEEAGVRAVSLGVNTDTAALRELARFVDSGFVRPHVDVVFPLEKIQDAFRLKESGGPGRIRGKVVIAVRP